MARIERTTVNAIVFSPVRGMLYAWGQFLFTTFIDNNGNKFYFVGEEQVTKEDGNARFLELKKQNNGYLSSPREKNKIKDSFKVSREVEETTYEELLARLENSIDRYTEYIDNPKQQYDAEANNRKIQGWIEKLKELIKEDE